MKNLTTGFVAALAVLACSRLAAAGFCAQPVSDGPRPVVRDCVYIAKASIGLRDCASCVCDVDGSGSVQMTDALVCLRHVVGNEVELACPECSSSTTTSTTLDGCASCNDVLTGARDYEDLCPLAKLLYDDMEACPGTCIRPCVCGVQIPELPPCEPQPISTCFQCLRTQCTELTQNCRDN